MWDKVLWTLSRSDLAKAVVMNLHHHAENWTLDPQWSRTRSGKAFYIADGNLWVWVANKAWGIHLEAPYGNRLRSFSSIALSFAGPSRRLMWNAYQRWLQLHSIAEPDVEDGLIASLQEEPHVSAVH